jgi:hypothetical protein
VCAIKPDPQPVDSAALELWCCSEKGAVILPIFVDEVSGHTFSEKFKYDNCAIPCQQLHIMNEWNLPFFYF